MSINIWNRSSTIWNTCFFLYGYSYTSSINHILIFQACSFQAHDHLSKPFVTLQKSIDPLFSPHRVDNELHLSNSAQWKISFHYCLSGQSLSGAGVQQQLIFSLSQCTKMIHPWISLRFFFLFQRAIRKTQSLVIYSCLLRLIPYIPLPFYDGWLL